MKPICDEEIVYPLAYPYVVYIIRINQPDDSPLLSHKMYQPVFDTFESQQYPFVALLLQGVSKKRLWIYGKSYITKNRKQY